MESKYNREARSKKLGLCNLLNLMGLSRQKFRQYVSISRVKKIRFDTIGILIVFVSLFVFSHFVVPTPMCEPSTPPTHHSPSLHPVSQPVTHNSSGKKSLVCPERSIPSEGSNSIKNKLQISSSIWKQSVHQRHAWISSLGNNISSVNPWDAENYVFFWNYFPPSFNCPHSLQRIGFIGDGGKWICGLELYETISSENSPDNLSLGENMMSPAHNNSCIIYSFGVANESSFEAEMLKRTNCVVFAYDYSVKNIGFPVHPNNPRVTFKALGIGHKNLGKFRTLKSFMEGNGHEWIDILKMDIEGGEYAALDKVMEDFSNGPLPFGQLLLEVHVDEKIFPGFYSWWERLEERGLRAFQSEVNHVACGVTMVKPNYVEYSFLNVYGQHRLVV